MINPKSTIYFDTNQPKKVHNSIEATLIVVITIITLIISFITSLVSIIVVMKLNLIPNMQPIEHNENLTLIRKESVFTNQIYLNENQIEIENSIDGNLAFETVNSHLKLNSDQIEFYAKNDLIIKSKERNEKIFPPDFNHITFVPISQLTISNGLQNVYKIKSPTDQSLEILTNNMLVFRGNDGLNLDGKQIDLKSDKILLNSLNSTINFDTMDGEIYFNFDNLHSSQKLNNKNQTPDTLDSDIYQHKLCVCGNSGLIFKLTIKENLTKCSDIRFPVSSNPCINRQIRF